MTPPIPPNGRRVLVIFHSLTGQTRAVLGVIAEALEQGGHAVDFAEVVPVGEVYALPYNKVRFFWEWLVAWLGKRLRVQVHPLQLARPPEDYDLILLGHQPWYLDTAIPMASWLETEQAQMLKGRRIVSVMTARTLWERAFKRVQARVEGLGGQIVDSFVLRNLAPMPQNMPVTLHYLFEGHDVAPGFVRRLGRFGVGESGLAAARAWGRVLSLRLSHNLLSDTLTHTEGNRQGLLRGAAAAELAAWLADRNPPPPGAVES